MFHAVKLFTLFRVAVRRIFLSVSDLDTFQSRATSVGGDVIESTQESCTIEGPEGVFVKAFSTSVAKTSDELFVSSLFKISKEIVENEEAGDNASNAIGTFVSSAAVQFIGNDSVLTNQ